jgi:N utilization substance protein B
MEMTGASADQGLEDARDRRAEEPQEREEDEPRGRLAEPDGGLLAQLVRGASTESVLLDEMIGRALTGDWSVERLEAVLRAILRAGAWELHARPQTPARVCISEYVDIAHAFYAGPEPGLVNAVMDRIAQVLRPDELAGAR